MQAQELAAFRKQVQDLQEENQVLHGDKVALNKLLIEFEKVKAALGSVSS